MDDTWGVKEGARSLPGLWPEGLEFWTELRLTQDRLQVPEHCRKEQQHLRCLLNIHVEMYSR